MFHINSMIHGVENLKMDAQVLKTDGNGKTYVVKNITIETTDGDIHLVLFGNNDEPVTENGLLV